jgi:hypothetical protein
MSKNIKIALLAGLCALVVLAVGAWRYEVAGTSRAAHAVIIRDRSDSVLSGCDCTAALVRRAFAGPHIQAGSTIAVTVTGDQSTASEPSLLSSVEVPITRQVLEGRDAADRQREKLIEGIKMQCEKIAQTKVSPVFVALREAVEHLRSKGCGPDSHCFIYAQSDLEETGDLQIKAALDRDAQPLPAAINNDGINIVISGVAQTTGDTVAANGRVRRLTAPRNPERAARIRSIWLRLFTNPERVTFEPFCPAN